MDHKLKYTGLGFLPPWLCKKLGVWSKREQKNGCNHLSNDQRPIFGDERNMGYRYQCMACGWLYS